MGFDATRLFEERFDKSDRSNEVKMINPVAFEIGPFSIRWYALVYCGWFDFGSLPCHEGSY